MVSNMCLVGQCVNFWLAFNNLTPTSVLRSLVGLKIICTLPSYIVTLNDHYSVYGTWNKPLMWFCFFSEHPYNVRRPQSVWEDYSIMHEREVCGTHIPANTTHLPNVLPMLAHRLRRWSNIGQTLGRCVVFAGMCLHIIEHNNYDTFPICINHQTRDDEPASQMLGQYKTLLQRITCWEINFYKLFFCRQNNYLIILTFFQLTSFHSTGKYVG